MKTVWFQDLKEPDRSRFKATVEGSEKVLDKAVQILYNMIMESEKVLSADYDSPSWAYKQADRNGYVRALKDVINILKIKPDRET